MNIKSTNISTIAHCVDKQARHRANGHKGGILWFTGLSGSGKTTLGMELEQKLFKMGYQVYVLDGDNVRHGLNSDLGFSSEDRAENIRRIGETTALFADAGYIVISAFISPYKHGRQQARKVALDPFYEVYLKADLDVCEERDPKGLYAKARAGLIKGFTGIDDPYEPPDSPEIEIDTLRISIEEAVGMIIERLRGSGYLP